MDQSVREQARSLLKVDIKDTQQVSGGSINRAAKVKTADGKLYFIKWNGNAAADMFPKEANGLQKLHKVGSGLRIPEVIGTDSTPGGTDLIIMTYIGEGTAKDNSHELLGKRLAALHRNSAAQYGLGHNNYIGKLPQSNKPHDDWIDFFIRERLEPQLQMASDAGKISSDTVDNFERLYTKLPDILAEEPPSLLHGDLWGGNYFFDHNGEPAIFDPAIYYGNREIEIAFTHLFGGFSPAFYDAYNEAFPLQSGFSERKNLYNLYPLLVHANLFGASYARRVKNIVQHF